jgi:hypothetical protein
MKVICELYGRDFNKITDTEIDTRVFAALLDNPFPASEVTSAVICECAPSTVRYRVVKADAA